MIPHAKPAGTHASKVVVRPHTESDYAWSRPHGLVEKPGYYPGETEAWVYCDKFSYDTGENVSLKVHTTAETYDVEIIRDGYKPRSVFHEKDIPGKEQATPDDASASGCGWEETLSISLDEGRFPAGFYLVIVRVKEFNGRPYEREGFFIVKSKGRLSDVTADADLVLVHTTCTMLAYNDWGGANHYRGIADGYQNDIPSALSSTQRPVARGMLRIPQNAPRESNNQLDIRKGDTPRYPTLEYSWYFRYSRHYADAGWATYERPFTVWAERQGYRVHHLTQSDLHTEPNCLDGYKCAVVVGHDEYHTWEGRDVIDSFVDRGGRFARFGGNFLWQVRFDETMSTQYCYRAPQLDPESSSRPERTTTLWDWPDLKRPGAHTVGLTGLIGCYTKYGMATPRATGGFQVYRAKHWAFADTDLRYGDSFGTNPLNIAAFEVDGCDYTVKKGLPFPTGEDGTPKNVEILAMCPATSGEVDEWGGKEPIGGPAREV